MVVITESVHPRSLSFANQRKAVILRDKGQSFPKIAEQLLNLKGEEPTPRTVANTVKAFSCRWVGRRRFKYHRCGRKAWKLTPEIKRFLIKKLLELRKKVVCTTTTLQQVLARQKGVQLEASTIQKHLKRSGYKWL